MREGACSKSDWFFPHVLLLKGHEKGKTTKTVQQLLHHTKPQDSQECSHFSTDAADEHSYHTAALQALKRFTCESMP